MPQCVPKTNIAYNLLHHLFPSKESHFTTLLDRLKGAHRAKEKGSISSKDHGSKEEEWFAAQGQVIKCMHT